MKRKKDEFKNKTIEVAVYFINVKKCTLDDPISNANSWPYLNQKSQWKHLFRLYEEIHSYRRAAEYIGPSCHLTNYREIIDEIEEELEKHRSLSQLIKKWTEMGDTHEYNRQHLDENLRKNQLIRKAESMKFKPLASDKQTS